MPIIVPDGLPATQTLRDENIFTMHEGLAVDQDIRPLQVVLLNLMPTKVQTETQFARLLGNGPLQVELTLLRTATHHARNVSSEHMLSFYHCIDEIRDRKFDGMVITGAPVELLPFEEVEYWDELCDIMDWSLTHVHSTLHICWGAQAGLYHHYGIPKYELSDKTFGIFAHKVEYCNSMLFRGSDDVFMAPQSRHTTILRKDIEKVDDLQILASSDEAGIYAIKTRRGRQIFITGHAEYDTMTLDGEYRRDRTAGRPIAIPRNYYPSDDTTRKPMNTWRSSANLLFLNWLNYFVYQETPFALQDIGVGHDGEHAPLPLSVS